MIVAYYGHPSEQVFGRVQFSSWEQARMHMWNQAGYYDLHDASKTKTQWDRAWEKETAPKPIQPCLPLG